MVYVKHFDILGVDTAQIPCIELQGVPNSATVGAVGLLGIDVTSEGREVYLCTDVNGSIYTWQSLKDGKDGSCVAKGDINSNGELVLTLSDGKVINAGPVKGDQGQPGANGRDGDDGVSVSSTELNANGELIITLSNGVTTNVGKVVGSDGVSIVKVEMNASYEILVTLSNDTVINVGQPPASYSTLADVANNAVKAGYIAPNTDDSTKELTITNGVTESVALESGAIYLVSYRSASSTAPQYSGVFAYLHENDENVGSLSANYEVVYASNVIRVRHIGIESGASKTTYESSGYVRLLKIGTTLTETIDGYQAAERTEF